jgi:hypothetical protein
MPTFKTLLRAAVMLAAAIAIVKGWQLYGPTTQQLKSWTARFAERVHVALSDQPQLAPEANEAIGNSSAVHAVPANLPPLVVPTPGRFESTGFPAVPAIAADNATSATPAANQIVPAADTGPIAADRMPSLIARLERLGAVDTQLAPWGSSGNLHRFSCKAALAGSRSYTRHFEAVAAEPHAAVEQVVSKLEAWRTEQGASDEIR